MKHPMLLLLPGVFALLASLASGFVVDHTLNVGNHTIKRLCQQRVIIAANGYLPGPIIRVREGDTLFVHVHNKSPYNCSIHWHGVFQLRTAWADGPSMITQCPIRPGHSYTYKFNLTGQEGTLWWHAHFSWLRATVHGALIIHPREAPAGYPFPVPYREVPILLGEWWNGNVIDIENAALAVGASPNISDAFTINGKPGHLYPCSENATYKLTVKPGKTYLLRIINAALNNHLFFKIANHSFTVVGVDACYTDPYHTDVVVLAPGQTADVLMTTDKTNGTYYMAAHPYVSAAGVTFDNTTTTGILRYKGATSSSVPEMPVLPPFNDTPTAYKFYSNLTSLANRSHGINLPKKVDEHMYVTIGLGFLPCRANSTCKGPNGLQSAGNMNNVSFQFPRKLSLLQAYVNNVSGIYTEDFPSHPLEVFSYTNTSLSFNQALLMTGKGTRVKKIKYNTTVEIVLQDTAVVGVENHPMHLHGNNFYVLAQGFGNYNSREDAKKFNVVNPLQRNTIGVPAGGWAVIRFQASNPGVWLLHCHFDVHLPWGLATAFIVENGPTSESSLPPPPPDLPKC